MSLPGSLLETPRTRQLGIEVPLICGAMYPCSNPELVAAVSEAGGIGVIQPLSMVYVHGHEFGAGLKLIRSLTARPVGMNVIVEKSSKVYQERMQRDRKSTRLNSSHLGISYAVFCLKKKKTRPGRVKLVSSTSACPCRSRCPS